MSLPVTIENHALRLEVHPHFGGKVQSIVDKADDYELLFDYPDEFPTTPQYDRPYASGYYAGWDECFPAVAAGPYPGHPYGSVHVPDHGELWGLPTSASPMKDGIVTEWNGLRFGYRLTRRLWLEGNAINAEYALTNLAPFEFRFVWAMHALMSLRSEAVLELPGGAYRLYNASGQPMDQLFEWPRSPWGEDFSQPAKLPAKRCWKCFSVEPALAPAVVRYPARGRGVTIEYSVEEGPRAFWGVWINSGGWMGHNHLAVEPTTGRYDELDRSVRDGSAGSVAASGKALWRVRWTVG